MPLRPADVVPNTIPLACNICLKRPDFSDVSHLLTHIASKAHLSTYYKIKIKSAQQDDARILIEEYDDWYATHGIEELMSERLNLKETRKRQKTKNISTGTSSDGPISHVEPALDPYLETDFIRGEIDADTAIESVETDQYGLPTPTWPPLPWSALDDIYEGKYEPDEKDHAWHLGQPYLATPVSRPAGLALEEPVFVGEDVQSVGIGNGESRLKGLQWPGMDMFDAATPETRRKRNQKKTIDVVDRLEASSREIEATEVVYSIDIEEEKSRPITGFPHSSVSPFKKKAAVTKRSRTTSCRNKSSAKAGHQKGSKTRKARTTFAGPSELPSTPRPKRGRKAKSAKGLGISAPDGNTARDTLGSDGTMSLLTSAFSYAGAVGEDDDRSTMSFRPLLETHRGPTGSYDGGYMLAGDASFPQQPIWQDYHVYSPFDFLGHESIDFHPDACCHGHGGGNDDHMPVTAHPADL